MTPSNLPDDLATSLGERYALDRELGGGGMARVFVAREVALDRLVVVKVLSPDIAGELSNDRFQREIRFAATLQQANIVPLLTTGTTTAGLPFYTMPFVEGDTLRARLTKGPLGVEEALSVLRDVARALDYAHQHGVVHRDLKPENVLLSGGTAVVADFGIAKALSASKTSAAPAGATLTSIGTTIGTPAYMAPEQAAGGDVDARADIYAWGVIAYELLCGAHPFAKHRTPQQLITAHLVETPVSLTTTKPGILTAVTSLVMRALAKDPADRPQQARELIDVLERGVGLAAPAAPSAVKRAAIGGGLLAAALIGAFFFQSRSARADEAPIIAVLPFDSEGVDVDSMFAAGLTDAVTSKLSRVAGLRVIDRRSAVASSGQAVTPQAIGKELGAAYVLRATVRWTRGADGTAHASIVPALIRVSDGTTRWAGEPEQISLADPFAAQARLATRVADELNVALAPAERTRIEGTATRDTAAYAAYVRAKLIETDAFTNFSVPRLRQALALYERAYRRDPAYADAIGAAASLLGTIGEAEGSRALMDSGEVLGRRALARDPTQFDAVGWVSWVMETRGEHDAARAMVRSAVEASPSNVRLVLLDGDVHAYHGDSVRALAQFARAVTLAPRSVETLSAAAGFFSILRRYQDAADLVNRAIAIDSTRLDAWSQRVVLAERTSDREGLSAAVKDFRARGGQLTASTTSWLRHGNAAMRRELANATPEVYGTASRFDSLYLFHQQTQLALEEGNIKLARELAESGLAILTRPPAGPAMSAVFQRRERAFEASFAGYKGDRAQALRALGESVDMAMVRSAPASREAANYACITADVHGLLGDVDAMIGPLEKCLTLPYGYARSALRTEPEFIRHLNDPRVRALDVPPKKLVLPGG